MTITAPRSAAGVARGTKPRVLHLAIARSDAEPWWWRHVDHDTLDFAMDYVLIVDPEGRPRRVRSRRFWRMAAGIITTLFRARRDGYDYILTGECDWTTFIVAGVQTLFFLRRPRHVVLQFIMREKMPSLPSRLKYGFMRWCFASVALCICSARPECDYYATVFGWPKRKLAYVPFHTDPAFLDVATEVPQSGGYAVAAGRTFRDYETLLAAFEGLDYPLVIVGYRVPAGRPIPPSVTVHHELPLPELTALIAGSSLVILPLQERAISIGQSVLLQAMAMAKPVVVSRVNGTVDYIDDGETGMFVRPGDADALGDTVRVLASGAALRARLGNAARARVEQAHLLTHYLQGVSQALTERFGGR